MKSNINWGIVITIILGIGAIILSIYLITKTDKDKDKENTNGNTSGNGSGSGSGSGAPTAPNPAIGKDAYASIDGVKVYTLNYSVYKTAAKDEWLGTVKGISDNLFYLVSGNLLVAKGSSYLN